MAYASSQLDSKAERNQINEALRASPQWRSAIQAFGLNPDGPLKLSKSQQQQLAQQLGLPTSDFHIDGAGNINDFHGWKGLPTAAKVAIIAGAAVGTAGAAGAFGGGAGAASAAGAGGGAATGATAAGAAGIGTGAGVATAGGIGATALRYGLQYGLPTVANLVTSRSANNAQRDSDAAQMDYYNKALEAEKEERDYRRKFDEEGRDYTREFGEEGRRYGRYNDSYGRESDEEDRRYGRAGDDYGRLSNEEILAYDRSQAIRDKNYGYQQYGNFVETLEPFRAGGSAAASRMSGLMGGPVTPDTGSYLNLAKTARDSVQAVPNVPDRPTWNYTPNRPTWNYPGTQASAASPMLTADGTGTDTRTNPVSTSMPVPDVKAAADAGGARVPVGGGQQLVRIQSPDGEIRSFPPDIADAWIKLGGKRVS